MRLAACITAALVSVAASAGEIGVAPLRIELTPVTKSAVVTVTGKTGPGQFVQVSAMRWSQDENGQDRYAETGDLVFLPKNIDLAKGGKQIVRVGIDKPVTDIERTYRLFIRETPPPFNPSQKGAQVAVVVDFGLPVFVMASKPTRAADLRDLRVEKGMLTATVVNTGNTRLMLSAMSAGKTPFSDFRSWYLLAGASRTFKATLPKAACNGPVTVRLDAESVSLNRQVAVTPQMCS